MRGRVLSCARGSGEAQGEPSAASPAVRCRAPSAPAARRLQAHSSCADVLDVGSCPQRVSATARARRRAERSCRRVRGASRRRALTAQFALKPWRRESAPSELRSELVSRRRRVRKVTIILFQTGTGSVYGQFGRPGRPYDDISDLAWDRSGAVFSVNSAGAPRAPLSAA